MCIRDRLDRVFTMKGIFKIISHSSDTKTISIKFNRLHSQTSIEDCQSLNVNYSNYDTSTIETFSSNLMRKSGQSRIQNADEKLSIISANTPTSVSGSFAMDDLVGKVIQGDVDNTFKTTLSTRKVEL